MSQIDPLAIVAAVVALFGLGAVIWEIAVTRPGIFLEIATDVRFALRPLHRPGQETPAETEEDSSDDPRMAA